MKEIFQIALIALTGIVGVVLIVGGLILVIIQLEDYAERLKIQRNMITCNHPGPV